LHCKATFGVTQNAIEEKWLAASLNSSIILARAPVGLRLRHWVYKHFEDVSP